MSPSNASQPSDVNVDEEEVPLQLRPSWGGGSVVAKHLLKLPDDLFSAFQITALCFIPVYGNGLAQEITPFGPGEENPITVNTNNVPSGADPNSASGQSGPTAISSLSEGGVFHVAQFPDGFIYTYVLPLKSDPSSEAVLLDRVPFLPHRKDMFISALTLSGNNNPASSYHHVFAAVESMQMVLSYAVAKNTGLPRHLVDIKTLAVVKMTGLSLVPVPSSSSSEDTFSEEADFIASSKEGRVIRMHSSAAGFSYCPLA